MVQSGQTEQGAAMHWSRPLLFSALAAFLAFSPGCASGPKTSSAGAGTFSISVSPAQQTVTAGSATTYVVTITSSNNFKGTVNLGAAGVPSGASATFSPSSLNGGGSSTVMVSTASSTAAGTYTLTLTGTSVNLTHSVSATLAVNATGSTFLLSAGVADTGCERLTLVPVRVRV